MATAPQSPDPSRPAAPATVTVQDSFGRPVQLPRAQWRKDVLPQLVDAFAHDPGRLAMLVMQHLRDGLAEDLMPAAIRLAAVDTEPERGLSVLAAVQRTNGDLEGSEETLRELLQRRPQSVAARVGLALVRDQGSAGKGGKGGAGEGGGDRAAATALLEEALQIDPNHPDALHAFLQWEHQRVGDDGYAAVLERVAAMPRAWRALLWRARRALQQGDLAGALADQRAALDLGGEESDALVMVAADLAQAGHWDRFRELVLPRYRLDRHHPQVGLHVLQLFANERRVAEGQQLLHELRVRFPRQLDQHLARFDAEFTRLALPAQPSQAAPPRVVMYRIDRPLWFGPLGDPEFLLPHKGAAAPGAGGGLAPARRILLATLSLQHHAAAAGATVQREDEIGRLLRSVPLFLAEQLWITSPAVAATALPVAEGGGWVVSGAPWQEDKLLQLLPADERAHTVLVTGAVRSDGDQRRIDLWAFDGGSRQRIGHAAAEGTAGKLGPALLQLRGELAHVLGIEAPPPPVGSEVFWDHHAAGLGQLAALVVAQLGAVPKERLFGQRAILEWLLAVALEEPRWTASKLALAAALCADAELGSPIHRELAQPFAELFRIEPANSAFAKIAVKPLLLLGLGALWQHRRNEVLAGTDARYHRWLQAVEAAPRPQ